MNHRTDADRWNFFANVMDGALFSFGMSLVSQATVLPVYVRSIGGGNLAVGLIPAIWTFGFNGPQFFIARHAQAAPSKKALLLKTAIGQRIPWLIMAGATFLLAGEMSTETGLAVFFAIYALAAVGGSLNLPVWFDLIATLTPVRRRGVLFGMRSILGSLLGILGGAIAAYVLQEFPSSSGFALLMLLAFLSMTASYGFLMTLKEMLESPLKGGRSGAGAFGGILIHLRRDKRIRNFVIADALQVSAGMGLAFYTVHAVEKFSLPESAAGEFTMIMMAATMAGGLVFGAIADRFGHRVNLMAMAGATLVSSLTALFANDATLYAIVFVFAALSIVLGMISRLPFLAELSSEAERPSVVALANLITSPFVFWGVAGGLIADAAGYDAVFCIAGFFALAALLWLGLKVHEPRRSVVAQNVKSATPGAV
ncbi:MAG: MFS transporter [Bacteroidota bacterium]